MSPVVGDRPLSEATVPCHVTSQKLVSCLGAAQNAQLLPPWHDPPIPWVLHWEAVSSLYVTRLSTDLYTSDQMTLGGGQRCCKQMF